MYLAKDILSSGYYFCNIYRKWKFYTSNCVVCIQNKKNNFKKPEVIQIIPNGPKDTYQIDLTEIPEEIRFEEGERYLLSIIDVFSKFGYNYILNTKKAEIVLGYIKDFINKYGQPLNIHTDNGKEFFNKLFENFCQSKISILLEVELIIHNHRDMLKVLIKRLKDFY